MEETRSDVKADVLHAEANMRSNKAVVQKPEVGEKQTNDRKMLYFGILALAIVAGAILAFMVASSTPPTINTALDGKAVNSTSIALMESIAMNSTLANQVGMGLVSNPVVAAGNFTPLTLNGSPEILYMGADYCPFCAVTRWGLILALMRFGNFSSLHYMTSSATDVFANEPTFTFYNSSYSSNLIRLVAVEEYANSPSGYGSGYVLLQVPTKSENHTFEMTDLNNTNVPAIDKGGIPFIDFGNLSIQAASPVSPQAICNSASQCGTTWGEILAALSNPSSAQAQAIIGTANLYTAQICKMTNYQPAAVCNATYIKRLA